MPQPKNELPYWLAALHMPGIGPAKMRRWLQRFANIQALFTANIAELAVAGLTSKEIKLVQNPNWHAVEADLKWSEKINCHIVTLNDNRYPFLLKELSDSPLVLYVRGAVEKLSLPQIAIVGSRNPSVIGKETAQQFATYLAKVGLVVTSGLAAGIDAACHRGALIAGSTIAVMGTGLNHIYPATHCQLAEDIMMSGALVSEFSPNTLPMASNFPRRNRIISGLSLGVVVIEAALRSGSLITARFAVEQGREVFAMPGSIHNPLAKGCHHLIREGAKLIETADDILAELGPLWQAATAFSAEKEPSLEFALEQKYRDFLGYIEYDVTSIDAIIIRSGLTAGEVSSMLLKLELLGLIAVTPGGYTRSVSDYC
jgi:DNA processing protein